MTTTDTTKISRRELNEQRAQAAEALVPTVAPLILSGVPPGVIAQQLGISIAKVKACQRTQAYQDVINKHAIEGAEQAVKAAKAQMSRLVPKAVKALERALECGNAGDELAAVKVVFKAVGLEQAEDKNPDATFNIILPGAQSEPTTIDVTPEVQDEEG